MKKIIILIAISSFGILFCGCPYETKVPLDKPTEKINPKLIGSWESEHYLFKITKHDEYSYYSQTIDKYTGEKGDTSLVYTTTINGVTLINLLSIKNGSEYELYKMEMKGDNQIKIFPLTSDIKEKFSTSDSLKQFVSATINKSGAFEEPWVLTRKSK